MKRRDLFIIILSLVISISASSQTTDCNGVVNGPAMVDTCGTCHQAYIYDFITHSTTFINDTIGIVLGATEMLVLPNNPMSPYWNDCDNGTTGVYNIFNERKCVRVLNMYGRNTIPTSNKILLYIYDDGTVEKKITK